MGVAASGEVACGCIRRSGCIGVFDCIGGMDVCGCIGEVAAY